ncbi:MAG: hypothetical protein JSV50_22310 [Desulfobacteraceae bacterium]|nr:MAG: hypothetical protein JSV50_22310 [Desulfobacteraceae bacterium]
MAKEILEFQNLEQYLLLKNGNYLYKIPFRDGFAVLKVYYGTRSTLRYIAGTISNYFQGQTSFMPQARLANERKCLDIWRNAGFRVFKVYEDVKVSGLPEGGYMLFEYLPALKFKDYFGNESVPLKDRMTTYRQFLKEWHRRHELAVTWREPRLIHENGDIKHVMIIDKGFLYFDFEMSFRSRKKDRVVEFVSREILAYLKTLRRLVGPDLFKLFLKETIDHYPGTEFLKNTYTVMFTHPNPIIRLARRLDRKTGLRAAKPHSKYNVALQLKGLLDGQHE